MEKLTRKEFLKRLSMFGLGALGATSVLSACGGDPAPKTTEKPKLAPKAAPVAADDPCGDLTGLTAQETGMRGTFKYVAKTPEAGKLCNNCALWIEPKAGETCGGCQIIKGPINPEGWCMQWVVKAS